MLSINRHCSELIWSYYMHPIALSIDVAPCINPCTTIHQSRHYFYSFHCLHGLINLLSHNNHIMNFPTADPIHPFIINHHHPSTTIHISIHSFTHYHLSFHHPSSLSSSIINLHLFIIITYLSISIYNLPTIYLQSSTSSLSSSSAPPIALFPRRTSNQLTTPPKWTQHS